MSRSGGREAKDRVTRVYEQHAPAVAAFVLRRSPSSDAPDIVAETFLIAWRRREILPEEPDTLPWLYGVARNVMANSRRGQRRQTRLAGKLGALSVDPVYDNSSVEKADEFSRVARAMHRLPDRDVELLRLASWEALTPTEIATVLEMAPGTVRQRLHRARARLRAELELEEQPTNLADAREEARR